MHQALNLPNNTPLPQISVIVPARDRPDRLRQLLLALERQTLPMLQFEVIVVDDGSVPPLGDVLSVEGRPWQLQLQFIRQQPSRGPAAARNLGTRCATGGLFAFTDDDCLPDPAWLETLVKTFQDSNCSAVEGMTDVPVPERETPYTIQMKGLTQVGGYQTCNFAVRAVDFAAIGGFDERFDKPHREDSDLAFALLSSGRTIQSVPDAVVVHPAKKMPNVTTELERVLWSRYDLLLWSKYPKLFRERLGKLIPITLVLSLAGWLTLLLSGHRILQRAGFATILTAGGYLTQRRVHRTSPTLREILRVFFVSMLWPLLYAVGLLQGSGLLRKQQGK